MADKEKVSKASVNYHYAIPTNPKHCGNCIMFHLGPPAHCDLVAGRINANFVCDKWEGKEEGNG